MAKRQVISCPWQDEQGNVLAFGTIVFEASGDALVSGTGELCSGIKGNLTLDTNGTVAASPAQYMWPTDQMSPSNITYTVWVYNANGQLAWGPNYGLTVPSGAGSFNLCTWVPNQIGGGSGAAAGSLTLQVNGVNNAVQNLLDLVNGTGITITDNGDGSVTIAASASGGPRPGIANWHYYNFDDGVTNGFATSPQVGMVLATDANGTIANQAATATEPLYKTFTSSSSANHFGGTSDNDGSYNDAAISLGLLKDAQMLVETPGSANVRYWACALSSYSGGKPVTSGVFEADDPSVSFSGSSFIGFRFSTAAGDTHWMCYAGDASGNSTTVSSGVALDTVAGHLFELRQTTPGTILFFIDGTQVGSINTQVAPLTAIPLSTRYNICLEADNVGVAHAVVVAAAYFYWESSK